MPDLSKITVDGTDYNVKDAVARADAAEAKQKAWDAVSGVSMINHSIQQEFQDLRVDIGAREAALRTEYQAGDSGLRLEIQEAVTEESMTRQFADNQLEQEIQSGDQAESAARQLADAQLQQDITDLKSAVKQYNAYDIVAWYGTKTDRTVGGVVYTWDAAKTICALSGQRSAASYNPIFNSEMISDGRFAAGETYHYQMASSSPTTVYIRVYFYDANNTSTYVNLQETSGTFSIPSGTVRVTIRIQCDIATSVTSISETIAFKIFYALSNKGLEGTTTALAQRVSNVDSGLSAITRTDAGINAGEYFAPWSVQLDGNDKFSLLDMPQNTIAYTLFRYIDSAQVSGIPYQVSAGSPDYVDYGGFNAVFIEKYGRGNFNIYRIYDATYREREVIGYYSSSTWYWYAPHRIHAVKIGMLGDSVTKGRIGGAQDTTTKGIPYWVRYETGMHVDNLGVGGMGWIGVQYHETNAMEYIKTIDLTQYDVITLQYGLNDGDTALGDYTDAPATDADARTIMGAVFRVVDYIYSQNATVQIIMINQTVGAKTNTFPYFNPDLQHSGAPDRWTFTEYFEEMRKFCEKYAIPLIDGYKGLNAWNRDTLLGDNVHPTEMGYQVLGRYIAGQIKSMI